MANIKSQKKRVLTNEKSRMANKALKSEVRKAVKKAKIAKAEDAANKVELINEAVRLLDKSQSKGVFKPNKVAREKSRLMAA
ncbi:30S ribosomal protein S20 [Mesoplasma lactucae]|uniref:Small ribosomal subunit protein bS20 n=1 Tax=Mesoplasma lactucae ATCC 49193 TaxID=81460 RepID=A0A291IRJ3_9MOLU|nr:30S ribosomal protein S20 [Mesoplasma lactucae]ATG97380.1 30S ribosomal protein S20 [Mesoplasma lactucae ATCC 49193]ATZ20167.1 30S ribosomal protein S20 [Mesoplasma lactucae ATCC 49193]MCL8216916.1 30S ribosomal protein S20 [Mesoplasma lactucae ATCC 49193]